MGYPTIDVTHSPLYAVIGIIMIALLFVATAVCGYHYRDNEIMQLDKENNYYRSTYKYRFGGTIWKEGKWLHYQLLTINGGKSWLALDQSGEEVLGDADRVYPGLVSQLDGLQALVNQATKHGPIDPSSKTGRNFFESAGFTSAP